MPDEKKPTKEDLKRGGFNPLPVQPDEPKEQVGPMPTDAPGLATTDDAKSRRKSKR